MSSVSVTCVAKRRKAADRSAADGDNDMATAGYTIGDKIRFFDDGATAANDTDTIAQGTYGPATGASKAYGAAQRQTLGRG